RDFESGCPHPKSLSQEGRGTLNPAALTLNPSPKRGEGLQGEGPILGEGAPADEGRLSKLGCSPENPPYPPLWARGAIGPLNGSFPAQIPAFLTP
ncbi:MAG: hypothetical protein ACRC8Y_05375, partial [Chroococcales cyanobacterium]